MAARFSQSDEDFLRMSASMDLDASLLNVDETQVRTELKEEIMEDGVPYTEYRPMLPPCRWEPFYLLNLCYEH